MRFILHKSRDRGVINPLRGTREVSRPSASGVPTIVYAARGFYAYCDSHVVFSSFDLGYPPMRPYLRTDKTGAEPKRRRNQIRRLVVDPAMLSGG
jgi:hypothetical protein